MRRRVRRWAAARGVATAALVLALGSCASLSDDVHLAPLYSRVSLAGGADEVSALAGAVRVVRDRPGAPVRQWELHPFVCRDFADNGDSLTRFLVPLGQDKVDGPYRVTRLWPIFQLDREPDANGQPSWRLLTLPGILWGQDSTDRTLRGVFPFGGVLERFATYDRITFVLFPLFMKTEREGGTFYHVLWPIFSYGHNGKGELDWHLWPFFGMAKPGESESYFVLWPFFLWSHARLVLPPEKQVRTWMVWPFYGRRTAGTYTAHTWLWPFFGYAHDPESGYWAWDGPFPLVRITRPGTTGEAHQTRVLPFYSYFEGEGIRYRWIVWPIFNSREESYPDGTRRGESVNPFWQHYVEFDLAGEQRAEFQQLWPLYTYKQLGERTRLGIPTLLPIWEFPDIDEHYAWIWELYHRETEGAAVRDRSWGGLWRREIDAREERDYLSGLWSRRKYREHGHTVRETSLLFGLLRWRSTRASGVELLRPAFPGPGWPARAES
jgi:hypothetical protein